MEEVLRYLPDLGNLTRDEAVRFFFWAALGAGVRLSYTNPVLRAPERTEDGIKLHAIAEAFTAVTIGFVVDTHPVIAFISALFGPDLIEEASRIVKQGFRARLRKLLLNGGGED